MKLLSAIIGNAGELSQDELLKKYNQLLIDGETIELG